MTHLEFVDKLNDLGISIRSTNVENKERMFTVPFGLRSRTVSVNNLKVKYSNDEVMDFQYDPLESLIKSAIDIGSWKHSWHHDITPDNYEKFREIIQQLILDRAEQIDMLLTTYFVLGKEISDRKEKQDGNYL